MDSNIFIEDLLARAPYFAGPEAPIQTHFTPGSKLLVVTGENTTGKSFFRRVLCSKLYHGSPRIEAIHTSQQGRGEPGVVRAFIYGDEASDSTGANSSNTILTGIATCRGRTNNHVFIMDEPDIGLSDRYAAGAGQTISRFCSDLPKLTEFVVVMSHNKFLVQELLNNSPAHLRFGDQKTLPEWISEPVTALPIEDLPELGHQRYGKIQGMLNARAKR